MLGIRRRDFITVIGGAAALPLAARAQQPAMPVIGYLSSGSEVGDTRKLIVFRQVLKEGNYVEGRNVEILSRYADNQLDQLRPLGLMSKRGWRQWRHPSIQRWRFRLRLADKRAHW